MTPPDSPLNRPVTINRRPLPGAARAVLRLFYQGLLISCVLTGLAFLGKYAWVIDLASHFRVQYLLFQVLGLLVLVLVRARFYWMMPVVLCAGLNLGFLLPYFPAWPNAAPAVAAASASTPVRVLHMNVLKYGNDYDGVARFIRQADPDVLSLQELNAKWRQALQARGVLKAFPFHFVRPQSEIALYTRLPVLEHEVIAAGPGQMAALHARVRLDGRPLSVIAMHPPAPVNAAYADKQRRLFAHMETVYRAGGIEADSLLLGDLNTTPFSWPYRRFVDRTGLKNVREGRGYLPSWPSFAPIFWIPIDHVLLGGAWQVDRLQVGPAVGSDHLPVLVELRRGSERI